MLSLKNSSPIRTITVGFGFSPNQSICKRDSWAWHLAPLPPVGSFTRSRGLYYAQLCYVLLMYTINIGYASFLLSGKWY